MRELSSRSTSALRMTMADVANEADERPGVIRLENADTILTPPDHVIRATREAVGVDDFNSYLPLRGLATMREAVAARYKEDFGLDYAPDGEVVITCGAGESMLNSLLSLVDPGDSVVLTNPTYSGMAQRVRLAGARRAFVSMRRLEGRWRLDLDELRSQAKGARAIFYASPVMPIGSVITAEETQAILDVAIENDAWIIFNGAADKVTFDGHDVINPACLPGGRERTLVIGCMSKSHAMPGWRIGWAAGPREVMAAMEDVHIFNGIMPSGFAQAGATAALTGDQAWTRSHVEFYQTAQQTVLDQIRTAPTLEVIPAEGGFNCLIDVEGTGMDAVQFAHRLMVEESVAVTPMQGWGTDDFGEHLVRLIYSNETLERLAEGGRRIAALANRAAGQD